MVQNETIETSMQ